MKNVDCGVYLITNVSNGKVYVGSTARGPLKRWKGHRRQLRLGIHINGHLRGAWNKYGESNFVFEVLTYCEWWELLELEQRAITIFNSANPEFGYNISPTAGSTLGTTHSPEARKKISEAIKLAHARPEVKALRSRIFNDPDYKSRHAVAMKLVTNTPEYRAKLSESCRIAQSKPEVKAKVLAALRAALSKPEYREKQRIRSTGRRHSEETKQKMRESNTSEVRFQKGSFNRGKKLSEETKARMRKPKSPETRENIRLGIIKGWRSRRLRCRFPQG
jgi:group I intron endonuclease